MIKWTGPWIAMVASVGIFRPGGFTRGTLLEIPFARADGLFRVQSTVLPTAAAPTHPSPTSIIIPCSIKTVCSTTTGRSSAALMSYSVFNRTFAQPPKLREIHLCEILHCIPVRFPGQPG